MRVAVDRLARDALLVEEGERMADSQQLTDLICSVHGYIMKHLRTRREIYGLIFHRSRVAAARRVDSPSVGRDLKRQRQDRVVTVAGRIYQIGHGKKDMKPHPLAASRLTPPRRRGE